jgi:hypothetical protein
MDEPHSVLDRNMRIGVGVLLALWVVILATRLETSYPEILVELYALPITRIALLGLVALLALWSPTLGILAALSFVCLGSDVIFLTKTITR